MEIVQICGICPSHSAHHVGGRYMGQFTPRSSERSRRDCTPCMGYISRGAEVAVGSVDEGWYPMSSTGQKRVKKQGRGRPLLPGDVAIEVVRSEQLDITKLTQALELYMCHLAEAANTGNNSPS